MGVIEEEESMDFSSSVRSQIPASIHREAFSSYQYSQRHSQRTSKPPSRNFDHYPPNVPVNVQPYPHTNSDPRHPRNRLSMGGFPGPEDLIDGAMPNHFTL